MTVLNSHGKEHISLAKFTTLSIVADASGSGRINFLPDAVGGTHGGYVAIAAGETKTYGPYSITKQFMIEAFESTLTVSEGPVDFPTASEVASAASAAIFPDADPEVLGAGYWATGVLTKSLGPEE